MVQLPKLPPSSVGGNPWVQLLWTGVTRGCTVRGIVSRVRDVAPTKVGHGGPPTLNPQKAGHGRQHKDAIRHYAIGHFQTQELRA